MTRTRSLLFSVAIAALLLSSAPAFAGTGTPGVPTATPAAVPALDAGQCTPPAQGTAAIAAPDSGLFLSTPGSTDFIICSCSLCKTHPNVVCRISPTGFSILCSDYYASRCV